MIGTSLGPYKIIEQLGAGGMGEVYLGEDRRLGRKVAIKVLPADMAEEPERLARLGRARGKSVVPVNSVSGTTAWHQRRSSKSRAMANPK